MTNTACMGGWCAKRDHCAHYHAASPYQTPSERLCPPGQDGAGLQSLQPIIDMRHYLSPEKRERIVSMLTPAGMPVRRIAEAIGCCVTNARTEVAQLANEGRIFTARACTAEAKLHEVWAFPTAEARDDFALERAEASVVRVRDYYRVKNAERTAQRRAEGRTRSARSIAAQEREDKRQKERAELRAVRASEAEQRKLKARLDREGEEAKKQRHKAEVKKTKARLRAETKAAGALVFKGGTDIARPKKVAWADIPVHNPNGVKPVEIESKLRDRYAVTEAASVVSSQECRPWAEAAAA